MLHLYLELVSESIGNVLTLSTKVFKKYVPDNQELQQFLDDFEDTVWARMRACEEMPDVNEIYTSVVAEFTEMVMKEVIPDADIDVDTTGSLTIDNYEIYNFQGFESAYKKYQTTHSE